MAINSCSSELRQADSVLAVWTIFYREGACLFQVAPAFSLLPNLALVQCFPPAIGAGEHSIYLEAVGYKQPFNAGPLFGASVWKFGCLLCATCAVSLLLSCK